MKKEQILDKVKKANVESNLSQVVMDFISLAYDEGNLEGINQGIKIATDSRAMMDKLISKTFSPEVKS